MLIGGSLLVVIIVVIFVAFRFVATPVTNQTPTPTDEPTPLPKTIIAADGTKMVLMPAGPFEMGSENGHDDEKPAHEVILDNFYIYQYEVTNAQYAACVQEGTCTPPARTNSATRDSYYGNPEYDNYPVIWVDWRQARTYCEWRKGRLPTEAEWEKAARGTDERRYPWGNDFDGTRLNFCDSNCEQERANSSYDDGYGDTAPVGSYPTGVGPYEVYDLAGNVWEWVQSDYRDYPYQADDGRENRDRANVRVLRGGSWVSFKDSVRASNRSFDNPGFQNSDIGFRCAR
jgi:serine/threonine-protein kinase